MNILQNRIDSFKTGTVKWPHNDKPQYHKIESFAKAGFYFVRRPKAIDTIRCFLCDKDFSNWKGAQSPFARHAKESPNCPWNLLNFPDANNKSLTVKQRDPSSQPRGSAMRSARLATFNNHNFWPPNKGMLSRSKRFPAASKLADAGFFFSPTLEQSARIKCPYCKISIAEPEKERSILDKHQELNNECIFFEPTHLMRAVKNRRDTVDSTKSVESFKTANSELEESMDTDLEYSLYEPSFIEIEKKKSKSKVPVSDSDSENEQNKNAKAPTKKSTKSKIIETHTKKRKASETTTNTGKRKRVEPVNDKDNNHDYDDPIWNIEQTFTTPSTVRKPVITFGNRKSRVLPSSRRSGPNSVDIFSNLKPSLIERPNDERHKKVIKSTELSKKSLIELPEIVDPTPKKPTTRRKLISTPKLVSENVIEKDRSKKSTTPANISQPNVNISSDSTEHLKTVSPSIQPSSIPKTSTTDNPISVENIEPVSKPYRDKGKGRAVEHNLSLPSAPTVKKPISLSKSKRNLNKAQNTVSFAPINRNSSNFETSSSESSTSNTIIPLALSDATFNEFNSTATSSHEPKIPSKSTVSEKNDSSPVLPSEDMVVDTSAPDNLLNGLLDTSELMETTPPVDFMNQNSSPKLNSSDINERTPSPKLNTIDVPNNNRTPSPQLIGNNLGVKSPPAFFMSSTPRTIPKAFMQSTPNHDSRMVNAFDIFGDCPMSPIRPNTKAPMSYQDTPVISGRTRNVIMKESDGSSKLVQKTNINIPPPLDINNIQPANITEKQKKMKVEEYLQGLFEQKIEQVREHGLEEIKKIQAASEIIKNNLTASMKH